MFGSKTHDHPCGRYPRIGPTACTKWFGPSIIPGPIYTSGTTSQPCSIDAGGNIFLRNEDVGISGQESTTTIATSRAGDSAVDRPARLWNETQHDAPEDSGRDPVFSLGENGGGTLCHAGGVLRCRSAGTLQSRVRGNCDGRSASTGSNSSRPTLRAYSAPLFLHSALFPPKHSTQAARGKYQVADSNTSGVGGRKSTRNQICPPSERRRSGEAKAPCRHRHGGYLHRYKGFEQEKVSCPPVATFRVFGGLGEFPRRRSYTAPAGKTRKKHGGAAAPPKDGRVARQPEGPAASPVRPERGSRGDGACGVSEDSPSFLAGEMSHATSTEEGRPSAYPLDLFAEGSNVAPESPPEWGVAAEPAWRSRSKGRPNGAKRQKAWGEGAVHRGLPPDRAETSKTRVKGGLTAGRQTSSVDGANRRFGAAAASSSPNNRVSSAFLPYSLERPVSPERSQAFFYTSN